MTPGLSFAFSLVRAWTALYTWRLPEPVREARRAEIESELWEFHADTDAGRGLNPAFHTLIRLVAGIPDDLIWRGENAAPFSAALRQFAIAGLAGALLVVAWTIASLQQPQLPRAPAAARLQWYVVVKAPPPPPPPPPPPCAQWNPRTGCGR
jgi:hypothetical protein